jgi:UDPglucose 6-dehydrogenase
LRRRAVVTGGSGFLGSHLVERLLDLNIDVLCLDNFLTGVPENVAHLQGRRGFHLQHADVTEHVAVPGSVDFVLHFASPASPVDYAEHPIQTLKVGAVGTLHTLGLAKEKGARFLLASTSEVYGDPLVHPQSERYLGNVNTVGPRACYDEAKRYAEALTSAYRAKHGVDSAIVRIFNTYGPRMRPDDGRAIPTFIRQALSGEAITVAGDGSQTRSVCYVDDLIDGVLRMLFSNLSGPVNLGNPHELSILQVAELVRDVAGSTSAIEFVARPADDPSVRQPDIELAQTELGWAPAIDVRDGIERTVAWFRQRLGRESNDSIGITSTTPATVDGRSQKVVVVGAGYVGAVTATCLAWLGHEVLGVDTDSVCAGQLNRGQAPFYEPGLPEMLRSALATGRLQFTDRFSEALSEADFIFLCVGTPPKPDGTPDLAQVANALTSLAPHLNETSIVINKSTVPVGSGNWTRTVLEETLPGESRVEYQIVSNPEFLREGSAINDFLHPDRIVLGGDMSAVQRVAELYRPVLAQSFEGGSSDGEPKLITTDLTSAEMIKYAANAFLGTKISFANEISNLCELVGADARQVLPAIGADSRIGGQFLSPGIGWGGSCIGKDVAALVAMGQEYGYSPGLLRAAVDVNLMQRAAVLRKLQRELRVLKGRRVALLGLAFKPGTDDLRDAPALDVARWLIAAGSTVSAYDPVVKKLPEDFGAIRLAPDLYDAAARADAVVLTTEWPEFRDIDIDLLRRVMKGTLLIDGRNFLREPAFTRAGVRLAGFGW